jgi:hypothetical protein
MGKIIDKENNPYELTDKQLAFCNQYLYGPIEVRFNGTQSAIKAGYSENTAAVQSTENLRKPNIIQHLRFLQDKFGSAFDINPKEVLQEVKKISDTDISEYLDVRTDFIKIGETKDKKPIYEHKQVLVLKDSKDWPNGKAIQSVKQSNNGGIEFKFYNKIPAFDQLLKMTGAKPVTTRKLELSTPDGKPLVVESNMKIILYLPEISNEPLLPPTEKEVKPASKPVIKTGEMADIVKQFINKKKGTTK